MVNIDEKKRAVEVIEILNNKVNDNQKLINEKNKDINEAIDSFYGAHNSESKDYGDELTMLSSINYAKSINNIANRQLERYKMMLSKPYFGRIDFKNEWGELPYYFGIETLIDNNEVIINDWRSPIANLYYEGVFGKASYDSPRGEVDGEITLKRQYKFENGNLVYFADTGMNISDELLIDILGKNDDVVMKNIVNTIQKEQNKAIRCIDDNDLLVIGVAGSGKTSIALHRIAYLVYKDSVKYDANKVCFITPNEVFFRYVDNVLPELGEKNVVNLTLNEIARIILKIELYKNKLRVENKIDFLEKVITGKKTFNFDFVFNKLIAFLDEKMISLFNNKLGLKIGGLAFRKEIFRELYFNKFKKRDYYTRRKFIKEYLLDRIKNERKITKNMIDMISTFVNKLLPEINIFEIYKEFLDSIGYEEAIFNRNVIGYEHIYFLCYIKIFFKNCKLFDKYNHLLIDEYQDLNIIEREVIQNIFSCNKTFVGDFNQKLFLQDYDNVINDFKIVELNNSYRSTIEIFDFLQNVIKSKGVNGVNRHGEEVTFKLFENEENENKYLRKIIKEYNGKSMAVVCKSKKMANKLYLSLSDLDNVSFLDIKGKEVKRGVVVSGVSLIKGLEFDKVIVYEANFKNYNEMIDKNYFYIACSRAINKLEILSSNNFTKFIGEKYGKNIERK